MCATSALHNQTDRQSVSQTDRQSAHTQVGAKEAEHTAHRDPHHGTPVAANVIARGAEHSLARRLRQPTRQRYSRRETVMDRSTAVVRGTHSANFYEMPQLSPSRASGEQPTPSFASTWGPSSSTKTPTSGAMRRGTNPGDLNASFQRSRSTDERQFEPAFAFDVNDLVSSLRRSTPSFSAMGNSSFSRSASGHSWGPGRFTQTDHGYGDARIDTTDPLGPRRGRRDALSGSESAHSQAPPPANPNSIIAYSLNRRKKKPIVGMPGSAPLPPQSPYASTPASTPSLHRIPSPPPSAPSSSSSHTRRSQQEYRPTTTIITPNGIEYTTEVPTRPTRVTSFYEESFTF